VIGGCAAADTSSLLRRDGTLRTASIGEVYGQCAGRAAGLTHTQSRGAPRSRIRTGAHGPTEDDFAGFFLAAANRIRVGGIAAAAILHPQRSNRLGQPADAPPGSSGGARTQRGRRPSGGAQPDGVA
jgi:hypothetical protein